MDPKPSIHVVRGLWCAMLTPIGRDGGVDPSRFARHAQALLAQGVDGVAPFGTTGEGQSFSMRERADGLVALLSAGIPPERVGAATGCAALTETIALTRESVRARCAGCLVLPPFFFKGMSDDGLFAWYARVIEAVADPRLRVFLYHIPQVSGIPLSVELVARLAAAFPGIVAGVKDSEGNWSHTSALLDRVPSLAILVGHEPHLPRLLRAGGVGTICGVANAYPEIVRALLSPSVTAADEERIARFISILFEHPFLPAFKAIVAAQTGDPGWRAVRPPWIDLPEGAQKALLDTLERAGMRVGPGPAV
jgi:4-hydroxy-tetrahydrodipicolinate synthase